jgi:hypothetical protein
MAAAQIPGTAVYEIINFKIISLPPPYIIKIIM